MKKWGFYLLLVCGLMAGVAGAAECEPVESDWTFLQICFAPGVPSDSATVPVNGVKVGAPISDGARVNGVEGAVLYAGSTEVNGLQGSLIAASADTVGGLQLSLFNQVRDCCGLQLGIVNMAEGKSFQIGLLNYVKDAWIPYFPVVNFKF